MGQALSPMQTARRANGGRAEVGSLTLRSLPLCRTAVQLLYLAYKNIFHKLRSSYKLVARIHYNAVHAPIATTGE